MQALATRASVEEAVSKKEAFIKRETANLSKVEKEVSALRDAAIKASGTLTKLKAEEESVALSIVNAERAEKELRNKLAQLDVAAAKQAEHAYNADYQIAQLEKKVRCLSTRSPGAPSLTLTAPFFPVLPVF